MLRLFKISVSLVGMFIMLMLPRYSASQVISKSNSLDLDDGSNIRNVLFEDVATRNFHKDSTYTFVLNPEQTDAWVLSERLTYNYDLQGREIEVVTALRVNNKWLNTTKQSRTFSDFHELVHHIEAVWTDSSKTWLRKTKRNYYYNYFGKEDEVVVYKFVEDDWAYDSKTEYHYDNNNHLTTELKFSWVNESTDWEPYQRIIYTYSQESLLLREVNQVWNADSLVWVNLSSRDYAYNNSNKLTSSTRKVWDSAAKMWVFASSVLLKYNDNGQLLGTEQQQVNSSVVTLHAQDASYDSNGNIGEIVHSNWNAETEEWQDYKKLVQYWSQKISGNLNSELNDISCAFMNPYVLGLPWYCEALKSEIQYTAYVYDLHGRLFDSVSFFGNSTFRFSGNIPSGFYNIVITGGLDYHTEKVLIRN